MKLVPVLMYPGVHAALAYVGDALDVIWQQDGNQGAFLRPLEPLVMELALEPVQGELIFQLRLLPAIEMAPLPDLSPPAAGEQRKPPEPLQFPTSRVPTEVVAVFAPTVKVSPRTRAIEFCTDGRVVAIDRPEEQLGE